MQKETLKGTGIAGTEFRKILKGQNPQLGNI